MAFTVFVEDSGTGLTDQADADFLDAAAVAAANHDENATDYAVAPPTLSVDYGVPEITLGAAQYRLGVADLTTRDHGSGTTTWPRATLVIQADQTTRSLTDGATNEIYVTVDLSSGPDAAGYDVRDDGSTPSLPSLLVATVDTSADTATVENDSPDIDAGSVSADALEATDSINAANLTAASTGNVLKKAASGTDLEFDGVSTNPNWQLDGEINKTSVTAVDYTLSNSYDLVRLIVFDINGGGLVNIQLNNVGTADYTEIAEDGSTTTGVSNPSAPFNQIDGIASDLIIPGRFASANDIQIKSTGTRKSFEVAAVEISGSNISSPLSSINLDFSNSCDFQAKVYGVDFA